MKNKIILIALFCLICISKTNAQTEIDMVSDSLVNFDRDVKVDVDMSFAFKTMNVFRGILPSRSPVTSAQFGAKFGDFVLGFYGGAAFDGKYTETDVILMYHKPRFDAIFYWAYNFREGVTHITNPTGIFDFNHETSIAIADMVFNYRLANGLKLTSSTFVYGRDKDRVQEDIDNGIQLLRGKQRYSQYFAISGYKKWGNEKLEANLGGSFSWSDFNGGTLYAKKPGFTDINVSYSRPLIHSDKVNIPIKASTIWNPTANQMYLVVGISLTQLSKLK